MNYNSIVVVNAKNANFNAGFDGMPRRLPNGKIFATDKALKYCIRQYLGKKGNLIFVERGQEFVPIKGETKQRYLTLKENYMRKTGKKVLPKNEKEIIEDLLKFIDVRLFGVVFAVDSNISMTGPCQISYGINQYPDSNIYTADILSPYRNPSDKSEEQQQTTKGEQSRADNVYYVYDVNLNMNSAAKQGIKISDDDIKKLKEALKYGVNDTTSCTKFGCEVVSMIWFQNKDDKILNNLNALVKVTNDEDVVKIDYSKVVEAIKSDVDIKTIEEYANKVKHILPK